MTPREIIAEAWAITTREQSLRRWAFAASFAETLLNAKLLFYQTYFLYKYILGKGEAGFFDIEIYLYHNLPFPVFATIIILFILMVVTEFFIPHLALGAIIGLAGKAFKKQKVEGGLVLGLYNFFPIFAIHEFLILSSFPTAITVISMILRYAGGVRWPAVIGVIVIFLFGNVLKFLFSFAQEGVVIEKYSIFESIGRSYKLIISHLGQVVFLLLLLLVISIRILINTVVIILIPSIILGIGFVLTSFLSNILAYSIATGVGLILIFFVSYFFSYLTAFKQSVWTLMFIELNQRKDLDIV